MAKHKTFDLVSPGFPSSCHLCPVPFVKIDKKEVSLRALLEATADFYWLHDLKPLKKP